MNYRPAGTMDESRLSIDQRKMKKPSKPPAFCKRIPALERLTGIVTRATQDVVRQQRFIGMRPYKHVTRQSMKKI